jgi:hypothetical protein
MGFAIKLSIIFEPSKSKYAGFFIPNLQSEYRDSHSGPGNKAFVYPAFDVMAEKYHIAKSSTDSWKLSWV